MLCSPCDVEPIRYAGSQRYPIAYRRLVAGVGVDDERLRETWVLGLLGSVGLIIPLGGHTDPGVRAQRPALKGSEDCVACRHPRV